MSNLIWNFTDRWSALSAIKFAQYPLSEDEATIIDKWLKAKEACYDPPNWRKDTKTLDELVHSFQKRHPSIYDNVPTEVGNERYKKYKGKMPLWNE